MFNQSLFSKINVASKISLITLMFFCNFAQAYAQNEKSIMSWEGYWGAKKHLCWKNENIPPIGFFSDRIENWEAMCTINHISKGTEQSDFDILHLQCKNQRNEDYSQDMRLKLLSDNKLQLVWPGGVGFELERCEPNIKD